MHLASYRNGYGDGNLGGDGDGDVFDGTGVWVVGGAVRDLMLKRHSRGNIDLDVVLIPAPGSPAALQPDSMPLGRRLSPKYFTWQVEVDGYTIDFSLARADGITDGRQAEIELSGDIRQDAIRRDFTFNAIYADLDGRVWDPFGGLTDLAARRVRFVGDPARRITEDYLRILRYVRMLALVGAETADENDANIALHHAATGNSVLARERVRSEIFNLLRLPNAAKVLQQASVRAICEQFLPAGIDWIELDSALRSAQGLICDVGRSDSPLPSPSASQPEHAASGEKSISIVAILAAAYHGAAARYALPDASPPDTSWADASPPAPQAADIAAIEANAAGHHGLRYNAPLSRKLQDSLRLTRSETRALHNCLDRLSARLPLKWTND